MANLGEVFDPDVVEAGKSFDLMQPHECTGQIIESDVAPTKAGDGKRFNFKIEIMDGPYEGRYVWDAQNIVHPSAQTQLIAQQRLKAWCEAVGHSGHLTDTEDLHFKPVKIKIGLSKVQVGYEQRNEIKGVKPLNGSAPPAGKPATSARSAPQTRASSAPPPSTAPKAAGSRPWGNRASA